MKVRTSIILSSLFVWMLTIKINAQVSPPGFLNVNLKVYLQGAITNPNVGEELLMRDDLRVAGIIPTTSPYPDDATTNTTVFDTTGNDAIVDWIWIEIRDEEDYNVIVDATSALLQRDGDIVATDGTSAVTIAVTSGSFYFVIKHRNHLSILTANPITLTNTENNINLSQNATVVFGESLALKNMENGIFAMYAGDATGDGNILNTDISSTIPVSGGINTYSNADINMDSNILNSDIVLFIQLNAGLIQQF